MGRAADLQWFAFGLPSAGAELRLHVMCPWRILSDTGILIGAADYWRPATADTQAEAFDCGVLGTRLRDTRNDEVQRLFGEDGLEVISATHDELGGFVLHLARGLRLEVFPDASPAAHDEHEFWRLFEAGGPHIVVGTDGLDYVADD